MKIEIITSANSESKETGFGSQLDCLDVMRSVKRIGHIVRLTLCETLNDLDNVVKRKPDFVVLASKYMTLKEGGTVWFSYYFVQNNVIHSGSDRETLRYDSDKVYAKIRLASIGIKTAKYFTAIPEQFRSEIDLPFSFPLFLKPTDAANGNGVDDKSFVETFGEFEAKVRSLHAIYGQPILVEEYLGGREFTVAITKSSIGEIAVSAIEIVPPESSRTLRILGATVKRLDTEVLQAIESHSIRSVEELAIASFLGLGVRGFGRIDVKMDSVGQCYFMEANLVPGMNQRTSYFPRAFGIANEILYDDVIQLMLDECFSRSATKQKSNTTLKLNSANHTVSQGIE